MSDIFDLRARVSADASPFNTAMDSSATSVSSSLSTISNAADRFIGNGVVRAFVKATNAAYEFGQVMADISSISDVGIQQLSKSIKQLDNVYGNVESVGNSIYNIISSGFDVGESELLSIVKNVGQASKSIRADLYSTANVFTTVANAYNLSADQFKDIADLMFVTVKEGKAEGNELARTLGLVVNTASEAGLSFAEMSAVISTLSRTQTTSQSMIGFNQMLNAMIKPSKEAADTAAQFGIEFGAAALKSKGFTAIIKDMHDKLQGNVEAINKISGPIRAMRAVVSLTGKQYENFIDILEKAEAQIGTGVAMEAFTKQTNTAKQALENLEVQLDKTFVTIGQDFEPISRPLTEFSENLLKAFSDTSGIHRWSIYATVIDFALKSARKTINTATSAFKILAKVASDLDKSTKNYADNVTRGQKAVAATNINNPMTQHTGASKAVSGSVVSPVGARLGFYTGKSPEERFQDAEKHLDIVRELQTNVASEVEASRSAYTSLVKVRDQRANELLSATELNRIAKYEVGMRTQSYKDAIELRKLAQQQLKDAVNNQRIAVKHSSFMSRKGVKASTSVIVEKAREDLKYTYRNEDRERRGLKSATGREASTAQAVDNATRAYNNVAEKLKVQQEHLALQNRRLVKATLAYDRAIATRNKAESDRTRSIIKDTERVARENKIRERYNRRFGTNYETYAQLKHGRPQKFNFQSIQKGFKTTIDTAKASISAVTKATASGIAKFGGAVMSAFSTAGMVMMVIDTVKAIMDTLGIKEIVTNAIVDISLGKHPYERKTQEQLDAINDTSSASMIAMMQVSRLKRMKVIDDIEEEELHNAISEAKSRKAVTSIMSKYANFLKKNTEFEIKDGRTLRQKLKDARNEANTMSIDDKRLDYLTEASKAEKVRRYRDHAYYKKAVSIFAGELRNEMLSNTAAVATAQAKLKDASGYKSYGRFNDDQTEGSFSNIVKSIEAYTLRFDAFDKLRKAEERLSSSANVILRNATPSQKADYTAQLNTTRSHLDAEYKALKEAEKGISDAAETVFKDITYRIEKAQESLMQSGITETDDAFYRSSIAMISKEVDALTGLIVRAPSERAKEIYRGLQGRLIQKGDEYIKERDDKRASDRKMRVEAGMLSESGVLRANIADLQKRQEVYLQAISKFTDMRNYYGKDESNYTYFTNRIAVAQSKLQEITLKLTEAFNELNEKSNEARKGLMDVIQSFTDKDNRFSIDNLTKIGGRWTYGAAGRMSNDALWHSVNLASRMGGIVRSRPYMISTSEAPNRQKAAQMRQQAQGEVSASIDAWIMSQKYAEANVGKTVTDIYTFMKQNNTIVVRNK